MLFSESDCTDEKRTIPLADGTKRVEHVNIESVYITGREPGISLTGCVTHATMGSNISYWRLRQWSMQVLNEHNSALESTAE